MQIDVDFQVFKALVARREHEGHTYNDVLRELLNLDSLQEPEQAPGPFDGIADALGKPLHGHGFYSRGLYLPDRTELRARYKQRSYRARIAGEVWVSEDGEQFASASAAAVAITGTNVNGLRFWEGKRPTDDGWRRLEHLRGV